MDASQRLITPKLRQVEKRMEPGTAAADLSHLNNDVAELKRVYSLEEAKLLRSTEGRAFAQRIRSVILTAQRRLVARQEELARRTAIDATRNAIEKCCSFLDRGRVEDAKKAWDRVSKQMAQLPSEASLGEHQDSQSIQDLYAAYKSTEQALQAAIDKASEKTNSPHRSPRPPISPPKHGGGGSSPRRRISTTSANVQRRRTSEGSTGIPTSPTSGGVNTSSHTYLAGTGNSGTALSKTGVDVATGAIQDILPPGFLSHLPQCVTEAAVQQQQQQQQGKPAVASRTPSTDQRLGNTGSGSISHLSRGNLKVHTAATSASPPTSITAAAAVYGPDPPNRRRGTDVSTSDMGTLYYGGTGAGQLVSSMDEALLIPLQLPGVGTVPPAVERILFSINSQSLFLNSHAVYAALHQIFRSAMVKLPNHAALSSLDPLLGEIFHLSKHSSRVRTVLSRAITYFAAGVDDKDFPDSFTSDRLEQVQSALWSTADTARLSIAQSHQQQRAVLFRMLHHVLRTTFQRQTGPQQTLVRRSPRKAAASVRNSVLLGTDILLYLMKSPTNDEMTAHTLDILLSKTRSLSPDALHQEDKAVLKALQQWLVTLITSGSALRPKALEVLISLAILSQSVSGITLVLRLLLVDLRHDALPALPLRSFLKRVSEFRVQTTVQLPSKDTCLGTWPLELRTNGAPEDSASVVKASLYGVIATDGRFVYVLNGQGLFKFGSGYHGTVAGHCYQLSTLLKYVPCDSLACLAGRLYYRSSQVSPASLYAIQTDTLQIQGRIFQSFGHDIAPFWADTNSTVLPFQEQSSLLLPPEIPAMSGGSFSSTTDSSHGMSAPSAAGSGNGNMQSQGSQTTGPDQDTYTDDDDITVTSGSRHSRSQSYADASIGPPPPAIPLNASGTPSTTAEATNVTPTGSGSTHVVASRRCILGAGHRRLYALSVIPSSSRAKDRGYIVEPSQRASNNFHITGFEPVSPFGLKPVGSIKLRGPKCDKVTAALQPTAVQNKDTTRSNRNPLPSDHESHLARLQHAINDDETVFTTSGSPASCDLVFTCRGQGDILFLPESITIRLPEIATGNVVNPVAAVVFVSHVSATPSALSLYDNFDQERYDRLLDSDMTTDPVPIVFFQFDPQQTKYTLPVDFECPTRYVFVKLIGGGGPETDMQLEHIRVEGKQIKMNPVVTVDPAASGTRTGKGAAPGLFGSPQRAEETWTVVDTYLTALPSDALGDVSLFTNEKVHSVVMRVPDKNYSEGTRELAVTRSFSAHDGKFISESRVELSEGDIAPHFTPAISTCTDFVNCVLWSYSPSHFSVSRFTADCYPTIGGNTTGYTLSETVRAFVSKPSERPCTTEQIAMVLTCELDRIARQGSSRARPARFFDEPPRDPFVSSRFNEPFAIEIATHTFERLCDLLKSYLPLYRDQLRGITDTVQTATSSLPASWNSSLPTVTPVSLVLTCLRVLALNLRRLVALKQAAVTRPGAQHLGEDDHLSVAQNSTLMQDLFQHLNAYLYESGPVDGPVDFGLEQNMLQVQAEACKVLGAGFTLFHPTPQSKRDLLISLLSRSVQQQKLVLLALRDSVAYGRQPVTTLQYGHVGSDPSHFLFQELLRDLPPVVLIELLLGTSSDPVSRSSSVSDVPSDRDAGSGSSNPVSETEIIGLLVFHALNECRARTSESVSLVPLLSSLQVYLLNRCSKQTKASDRDGTRVVTYVSLLCRHSAALLDEILHDLGRPAGGHYMAAAAYSSALIQEIEQLLVSSLLLPLITSLQITVHPETFGVEYLPALSLLTESLDKFCGAVRSVRDISTPGGSRRNPPHRTGEHFVTSEPVILESAHPYTSADDTNDCVTIPNAVYLTVEFDSRCSTNKQDSLILAKSSSPDPKHVVRKLSGPSNWPHPRQPVVIPGNKLYLKFSGSSFESEWGYKCTIKGHILPPPPKTSAFVLLHVGLCELLGKIAGNMLTGEPAYAPDVLRKAVSVELERWFESPLFHLGTNDSEHDAFVKDEQYSTSNDGYGGRPRASHMAFVKEMIRLDPCHSESIEAKAKSPLDFASLLQHAEASGWGKPGRSEYSTDELSDGALLVYLFRHHTRSSIPGKLGGNAVTLAEQAVAAATLLHSSLVSKAMEYVETVRASGVSSLSDAPPPPKALSQVWKTGASQRTFIVQQHQTNARQGVKRTYEEIAQSVFDRAVFLLSTNIALHNVVSTQSAQYAGDTSTTTRPGTAHGTSRSRPTSAMGPRPPSRVTTPNGMHPVQDPGDAARLPGLHVLLNWKVADGAEALTKGTSSIARSKVRYLKKSRFGPHASSGSPSTGPASPTDLVSRWVQCTSFTIDDVKELVQVRTLRAKYRAEGMRIFSSTLGRTTMYTARRSILGELAGRHNTSTPMGLFGTHYAFGIRGAQSNVLEEVQSQFFELVTMFVNILTEPFFQSESHLVADIHRIILSFLAMPFAPQDLTHLYACGVLDTLRHLLQARPSRDTSSSFGNTSGVTTLLPEHAVATQVWHVLEYLALHLSSPIERDAAIFTASALSARAGLHEVIFEFLFTELRNSLDDLASNNASVLRSAPTALAAVARTWPGFVFEPVDMLLPDEAPSNAIVHADAYAMLLVSTLHNLPSTLVLTPDTTPTLFYLLWNGTPRVQRLVCRIFRQHFPRMTPVQVAEAMAFVTYPPDCDMVDSGTGNDARSKEEIPVLTILWQICSSLATSSNPRPRSAIPELARRGIQGCSIPNPCRTNPIGEGHYCSHHSPVAAMWKSGAVQHTTSAELIMLCRILLDVPAWNGVMSRVFDRILRNECPDTTASSLNEVHSLSKKAAHVYGIFSILGGFNDIFRVGGRVVRASSPSTPRSMLEGTLVAYDKTSLVARVLWDAPRMRGRLETVSIHDLTPVTEVAFNPRSFSLSTETAAAVLRLVVPMSGIFSSSPVAGIILIRTQGAAIKSLASLCGNPETVSSLVTTPGALDALFHSAQSVPSESHRKAHQLEEAMRSLLNVLQAHVVRPGIDRSPSRRPVDPIPYQPFPHTTTVVPTAFQRAYVRMVVFDSDLLVCHFIGDVESDCAVVPANLTVRCDNSSVYYFEIAISDIGFSNAVGLGFYPRGHSVVEGLPGSDRDSFGYRADGHVSTSVGGWSLRTLPRFTSGDIVGCGWDTKQGIIFFTHNGRLLNYTNDNVKANELIPVVGLQSPAAKIVANFGQHPFRFNVLKLSKRDNSAPVKSPSTVVTPGNEAQVESLAALGFPRNLCLYALHIGGDFNAAKTWLTEKREVDLSLAGAVPDHLVQTYVTATSRPDTQMTNLARHKIARQSSTAAGLPSAARAVNGNITGPSSSTSDPPIDVTPGPFWEVDLGYECRIESVHIRCASQEEAVSSLQDAVLVLSVEPIPDSFPAASDCASFTMHTNQSGSPIDGLLVLEVGNHLARYVRIHSQVMQPLKLTQVFVRGERSYDSVPPSAASRLFSPMTPYWTENRGLFSAGGEGGAQSISQSPRGRSPGLSADGSRSPSAMSGSGDHGDDHDDDDDDDDDGSDGDGARDDDNDGETTDVATSEAPASTTRFRQRLETEGTSTQRSASPSDSETTISNLSDSDSTVSHIVSDDYAVYDESASDEEFVAYLEEEASSGLQMIDTIRPGMLLSVARGRFAEVPPGQQTKHFRSRWPVVGRIGIVRAVDIFGGKILMEFYNAETATLRWLWIGDEHVQAPLFDPSYRALIDVGTHELLLEDSFHTASALLATVEPCLVAIYARDAIRNIVQHWPLLLPFSLANIHASFFWTRLGPIEGFIHVIRCCVTPDVVSMVKDDHLSKLFPVIQPGSESALEELRSLTTQLLEPLFRNRNDIGLRSTSTLTVNSPEKGKSTAGVSGNDSLPVSPRMASQQGPSAEDRDQTVRDLTGFIAVLLTRCAQILTQAADQLTPTPSQARARPGISQSGVIHQETEFVMATWMIELLLDNGIKLAAAMPRSHLLSMYNAITRLAKSSRSTFRIHCFRLLKRIFLSCPNTFDRRKLERLRGEVLAQYAAEHDDEALFSPAMQSGVELLFEVDRQHRQQQQSTAPSYTYHDVGVDSTDAPENTLATTTPAEIQPSPAVGTTTAIDDALPSQTPDLEDVLNMDESLSPWFDGLLRQASALGDAPPQVTNSLRVWLEHMASELSTHGHITSTSGLSVLDSPLSPGSPLRNRGNMLDMLDNINLPSDEGSSVSSGTVWYRDFKLAVECAYSLYRRVDLPLEAVAYAWTDISRMQEVVATRHPYVDAHQSGTLTIEGADYLRVIFHEKSAFFPSDTLVLQNGEGEIQHTVLNSELAPSRREGFVVSGDTLRWKFSQAGDKVRHDRVRCDQCGELPVYGTRYKCLNCENFDYCSKCFTNAVLARGHYGESHAASHAFIELINSSPQIDVSINQLRVPCLVETSDRYIVHQVNCDVCSEQICGVRLKCMNCPDFNMCANPATHPRAHHNPTHVFLLCPMPLRASLEGVTLLPHPVLSSDLQWGFEFKVTPHYPVSHHQKVMRHRRKELTELAQKSTESFTPAMDSQLVSYVNDACTKMGTAHGCHISPNEICADPEELFRACPLVTDIHLNDIRFRMAILRYFNNLLDDSLVLIDTSNPQAKWSLGHVFAQLRGLIFQDLKMALLRTTIEFTDTGHSAPVIRVDRLRASGPGISAENTLFMQAFEQLRSCKPSVLRQSDQAFTVRLKGEGAEDAGGPYREVFSQFASEIQSAPLSLFIPVPNSRLNVGDNRDKYMPNPQANSPHDIQMFEFIGRLFGVAIRTSNPFVVNLPSFVWKPLVFQSVTRFDLEGVDQMLCQTLDFIQNIETEGVTPETFSDVLQESFVAHTSDDRRVELVENGMDIEVDWNNKDKYVALIEDFRLHEIDQQIQALQRGLCSVLPQRVLPLFTWPQLELAVCGKADFDVDFLRLHTTYHGVSPDEPHIALFWKVLETFTSEDRQNFLRFVWGRSRLPTAVDDLEDMTDGGLQIHDHALSMSSTTSADHYLPISHTCFFSLELPRYSSQEVMRSKLLYAITECREIDTDYRLNEADYASSDDEGF